MGDFFAVTLSEQIAEVKRELAMRRTVYPREVARGGRLTQARADKMMRAMEAVLATLEQLEASST